MKRIKYLIPICLILLSCKQSNKNVQSDCTKFHEFKLGRILFSLPNCYSVYRPDTLAHESLFLILKDNHIKLQGNAGMSLTSLDETISLKSNKSIYLYSDTIGNILRQIGYYKTGEKYQMIVNIINIKDRTTFIKDMLKGEKHINKDLADDQFFLLMNAGNYENADLTKEDIDILVSAFKKSKIVPLKVKR